MTIDEIMDETTISFKKDLTLEETEDLLKYVADNLPANISFHAGYFRSYRRDEDMTFTYVSDEIVEITGNIRQTNKTFSFDVFSGNHPNDDTSGFSSLYFARVPGWEISDYRPEIRQLWKDVRGVVNNYFETKNKLIKEIKSTVDRISAN